MIDFFRFFEILTEEQVKATIIELKYHLESIYDGNGIRAKNAGKVVKKLKRTEFSDRLNEIIDYLIDFSDRGLLNKVFNEKGFKDISSGILNFN